MADAELSPVVALLVQHREDELICVRDDLRQQTKTLEVELLQVEDALRRLTHP